MSTIEERVAVLEANQRTTAMDVASITTAVDLLSKQLTSEVRALSEKLSQRPSWFVTVLLTFLSSSCVGLLVAFITQTTH